MEVFVPNEHYTGTVLFSSINIFDLIRGSSGVGAPLVVVFAQSASQEGSFYIGDPFY